MIEVRLVNDWLSMAKGTIQPVPRSVTISRREEVSTNWLNVETLQNRQAKGWTAYTKLNQVRLWSAASEAETGRHHHGIATESVADSSARRVVHGSACTTDWTEVLLRHEEVLWNFYEGGTLWHLAMT
jgi:phage baseplate assembly protein gpV